MNITKKIIAVFLSITFLFSSLGITISSMVCLKSGKGKISLALIEDCCTKKKTDTVANDCCDDEEQSLPIAASSIKKADCCDISNITVRLNDFQNTQKIAFEQIAVVQSLFYNYPAIKTENQVVNTSSDLSPPLSGRELLSHISILII